MIIKSFTAETMSAALKSVRSEMGGDAVVLKTRQTTRADGKANIEVTACLDKPSAAQASTMLTSTAQVATTEKNRLGEVVPSMIESNETVSTVSAIGSDRLGEINHKLDLLLGLNKGQTEPGAHHGDLVRGCYLKMCEAELPEQFVELVISAALGKTSEAGSAVTAIRTELTERLSELIGDEPQYTEGDRILFVGPAGCGKTSALGKIAARLVATQRKKVKLVSLDNSKVGSHEEIRSYGYLLGADVLDTSEKAEDEFGNSEILLIDSPALPNRSDRLADLVARADRFNPNYRLVLFSSLYRSADVADFAELTKPFDPTHLIVTMLDLTKRWGTIVAATQATGLKLVLISDSPSGTGALSTITANELTEQIIPAENNDELA